MLNEKSSGTVLITGVAGLLGSRMAEWILDNKPGWKVVGIDNLFGGYIENVRSEVDFYKRELSSDDIADIFNKYNFDIVYHFAAYAAEGLSPFMRMLPLRVDRRGRIRLKSRLRNTSLCSCSFFTPSLTKSNTGSLPLRRM